MFSSDDESEGSVNSVSTYHLEDENADVSSFSNLPLLFDLNQAVSSSPLFLRGDADNGLRKVYVGVKAWTFDLTPSIPEISLLTVDGTWIKLLKPRKSFQSTVRSVLVTLFCLHHLRIKPEASAKSLWAYLNKEFRSHEVKASQNDLVEHVDLIREAVKRDESLGKCKFLLAFLANPTKAAVSEEDVQGLNMDGFIVEDVDVGSEDESDEEGDEDDELFDSVCSFCDNGGDLLCCEGRCMRSFHATEEAGEESLCQSLGLTATKVEDIQNFVCENCEHNKHQCFACGKLGSSDKSSNPEVFRCASAICGYFYHPQCVAKLLYPDDNVASEELQKKITAGESVTCPIHKCSICKQLENKKEPELQFAVCRRCPISYHRKCMPREIAFEDDEEKGIITRAWEGLLPGRILIYCLKHEIDDEIGTPVRNHVKFPSDEVKEVAVKQQNRKRVSDSPEWKEVKQLKKKKLSFEGFSGVTSSVKSTKEWSAEKFERSKKIHKSSSVDTMRKMKSSDASKKPAKKNTKLINREMNLSETPNEPLLGDKFYELFGSISKPEQVMPGKQAAIEQVKQQPDKILAKKIEVPKLDAESKRSIDKIVEQVASSTTLEYVIKKHELPHNTMYSGRSGLDKNVTEGKMQSAIDAVNAALKRLDNGGSIEDAKAICDSAVLNKVFKWKSKLRVYLAPFIHGMRYSSFGRHFTKPDKLQEIVDILHLYVKDGDMIVDFCCGANDFSLLMNEKLKETGKKCSFKNYDLFQSKNDFNFEKRSWMTVEPKELHRGSKLIIGLNPPFGVKGSLANKFIDKALSFKPKLLILIVPEETERLDQKSEPYDLVWEKKQFLSGKSFYLPGSVDAYDNQMDSWNTTPPPVYLWSRCDWTSVHKHIAQKYGHIPGQYNESSLENHHATETAWPQADQANDASAPIVDHPMDDKEHEGAHLKIAVEDHKESTHYSGPGLDKKIGYSLGTSIYNDPWSKRRSDDESLGRGVRENTLEDRRNQRKPEVGYTNKGMTRDSPSNTVGGRSSLDRPPSTSRHVDIPLQLDTAERGNHHLVGGRSSLDRPPSTSRSFEIPLELETAGHGNHRLVGGKSSPDRLPAKSFEIPLPSEADRPDDRHLFGGRSSLDRPPTRPFETPLQARAAPHGNRHFEHGLTGPRARYGTEYGGDWSRLQEDDMGGRFGINGGGFFSDRIHGFSNVNSEPPYTGYPRHGPNNVGFGSYVRELDREPNPWGHTDLHYNRMGSAPPVQYEHLPEASRRVNMMSVIDRYAPRLDELNNARIGSIGQEPPMFNRNVIYDSGLPIHDYNNVGPAGFPPGPYHRPYPRG